MVHDLCKSCLLFGTLVMSLWKVFQTSLYLLMCEYEYQIWQLLSVRQHQAVQLSCQHTMGNFPKLHNLRNP